MYRMELFECSAATPIPLCLKAGSTIRVQSGRLWLTVEGQADDVWLCADGQWRASHDLKVWLSAEPAARWSLLHPVESPHGWRAWLKSVTDVRLLLFFTSH